MQRSSFLVNRNNSKHLFIALTNEIDDGTGKGKRVLVVNVTTDYGTRGTDTTCLLSPGDHSFINNQSYIAYRYAELLPLQELLSQSIRYEGMVDTAVFERICQGVLESKHTPLRVVDFYNAHCT